MTVSIRLAVPSDARALAHVAAVTFPLACPPGTTLVEIARFVVENLSQDRLSEYIADARRTVLVAVDEDSSTSSATPCWSRASRPTVTSRAPSRPVRRRS
nr:hypothetical protein GCM10025699_44840 [Microbacterium flavescens]